MHISTKLLHPGIEHDPSTQSINTPIYQTSTFIQENIGLHKGYHYSRMENPTRTALEKTLAAIEVGKYAYAFGSGMAAIDSVISLLRPGEEVLVTEHLYGGTFRLFSGVFQRYGIRFRYADMRDAGEAEKNIANNTKMIWMESPTNPTLQIIDLARIAEAARQHKLITVADNTFATPYLQRPLELGVDIVVHSATKYLGGHSDVILGAVVTSDEALAKRIQFIQASRGAVPGPQDCFLVLRGIKTLYVRMKAHCENAARVAEFLKGHGKVRNLYWPGFTEHQGHDIAKKQMADFGGMVAFDLKEDTKEAVQNFFANTRIFVLAESLGGVESTMTHPASMSHPMLSDEERERLGVSKSLVRLSVGIEDAEDLVDDLRQALAT